jgi:hypothetical protein
MPKVWTKVVIVVAALGLAGGCAFDPRTPEPPLTGEPIEYLEATEAKRVVANAETALNNLDAQGWDAAISQLFTYENEVPTEQELPGGDWDNWDRQKEMGFINNFFNNVTSVEATLRQEDIFVEDPAGGEADWEFFYFVKVTDVNGIETRYRGRVEMQLRVEGTLWYINKWIDQEAGDDPDNPGVSLPTMGSVRAAFASK